jgi:hypothetical protein
MKSNSIFKLKQKQQLINLHKIIISIKRQFTFIKK